MGRSSRGQGARRARSLKDRVDELQKSVRTIDKLEKRLGTIEKRLDKLEGKGSSGPRKTSAAKRNTAPRKSRSSPAAAAAKREASRFWAYRCQARVRNWRTPVTGSGPAAEPTGALPLVPVPGTGTKP